MSIELYTTDDTTLVIKDAKDGPITIRIDGVNMSIKGSNIDLLIGKMDSRFEEWN